MYDKDKERFLAEQAEKSKRPRAVCPLPQAAGCAHALTQSVAQEEAGGSSAESGGEESEDEHHNVYSFVRIALHRPVHAPYALEPVHLRAQGLISVLMLFSVISVLNFSFCFVSHLVLTAHDTG